MTMTYGLFENAADLCATVNALCEAGVSSSRLSLMARDLKSDTGEQQDRCTTIAHALQALDISSIAQTLDPLALVVIPEAGTFLTAGWPASVLINRSGAKQGGIPHLDQILQEFGHVDDEATFLSGRLSAGALMLGVDGDDADGLAPVREIFADQQAVYVGMIESRPGRTDDWNTVSIASLDGAVTRDLILVDFSGSVIARNAASADSQIFGRPLSDGAENEVGSISAVLLDRNQTNDWPPQYIAIERGGLLGMGKKMHILPFSCVDVEPGGACRTTLSLEIIENAPAFETSLPFSRREEQIVCAYYGTTPYWEE